MAPALDLGELWRATLVACRRDLALYLTIAAAFVLLPNLVADLFGPPLPRSPLEMTGTQLLVHVLVPGIIGGIAQLAICRLVVGGRGETAGGALRLAVGLLPGLIVALTLGGVAMGLGLLALVIPGLYLWARLALVLPLIAVEGLGPIEALKRSFALTEAAAWRILGFLVMLTLLTLLGSVLIGGVGIAIGSVLTLAVGKGVGALAASTVTSLAAALFAVLGAVASGELYRRLR